MRDKKYKTIYIWNVLNYSYRIEVLFFRFSNPCYECQPENCQENNLVSKIRWSRHQLVMGKNKIDTKLLWGILNCLLCTKKDKQLSGSLKKLVYGIKKNSVRLLLVKKKNTKSCLFCFSGFGFIKYDSQENEFPMVFNMSVNMFLVA